MTNASEQTRRIGLYGGSFNPPHMAHVMVLAWALATGEIDEAWVIPTGGHPFGKALEPFDDRLEMCRRAFACLGERVRLLEAEREPVVHYSIDTLERLRAEHPAYAWRWIMGSDTLADAPHWRRFEDLMRLAPPLIVPRQGHGKEAGGGFSLPDISSTELRRRLAEGHLEGLENLAPRPVLDYIRQRGLYLTTGATKIGS